MFPEDKLDPIRSLRLLSELGCVLDTEVLTATQIEHGKHILCDFSAYLPVSGVSIFTADYKPD